MIFSFKQFNENNEVLLAPNGKVSNLNPTQYKLVRTPEFKSWFGDWENDRENSSKVIDENGEPRLANHYSNNDNIISFKKKGDDGYQRKHSVTDDGIYFNLADIKYKYGKYGYYVFLNFRKPFKIKNYISDVVNPYTNKNIELEYLTSDDIKYLTEQGYDSVMSNIGQIVAFDNDQIKIAYKK